MTPESPSVFQPALIFLTYSFPSRTYLRQIRRVFRAPTISSYGSTETGHVFMECEDGRLHQNTDHCRVDFQPWAAPSGGPDRGRLLVTVFHNSWFIVLRFDIGDVARLDTRGPCPCGRTAGLTLAAIEGRIKDVTFTPDGRVLTVEDLDAALATAPGIDGWQLDLPDPQSLRLRLLAEPGATDAACREAREQIARLYGSNVRITVTAEDTLQPEASGKFRFVRTAFPCLGFAPILCDTHAEADDWEELKALLGLSVSGTVGFGIPSGGALCVAPDGTVTAIGKPASRFEVRNGRIKALPPLPPDTLTES